jgi:hypothetical protein
MFPAIDVHAHLGIYNCGIDMHRRFMSGDAEAVTNLASMACTTVTIVSSLRALNPEGEGDAIAGNNEVLKAVKNQKGLRFWAVLDPRRPESFIQCERLLVQPKCAGLKVHPEMHEYHIKKYGRAIFAFAEKKGAVVQSHSGQERSLPLDFVPFADTFPGVRLILSHLGYGWDRDLSHQVRAIQRGRNDNIYTDTSSMSSLFPNLIEWAVKEVGAEKILFGTDSPLYFAPMMRARINHAGIKDKEKKMILSGNAQKLFGKMLFQAGTNGK